MDEQQEMILKIAATLMNGLIVKGVVKAGQATDYYNVWCIKKAIHMYVDTKKYLHK